MFTGLVYFMAGIGVSVAYIIYEEYRSKKDAFELLEEISNTQIKTMKHLMGLNDLIVDFYKDMQYNIEILAGAAKRVQEDEERDSLKNKKTVKIKKEK